MNKQLITENAPRTDYHSKPENDFYFSRSRGLNSGSHFHRSFELYTQTHGTSKIIIDLKEYILTPGESVLIFPFQAHSYESESDSDYSMVIFSPDLIYDFFKTYEKNVPSDNRFEYLLDETIDMSNSFLIKAIVYGICGQFEKNSLGKEKVSRLNNDLITNLLMYAEKNFCSKCLIIDAAEELGYDYAYISKQFKKKLGISFNRYVNILRIKKCQYYIKNTTLSLSEIMTKCGFSSLRSFDRNFRIITGKTPSEYRHILDSNESTEDIDEKWNKYTSPLLCINNNSSSKKEKSEEDIDFEDDEDISEEEE